MHYSISDQELPCAPQDTLALCKKTLKIKVLFVRHAFRESLLILEDPLAGAYRYESRRNPF